MPRPLRDRVSIPYLKGRRLRFSPLCQTFGGILMQMSVLTIQMTDAARIGGRGPAPHQLESQAKGRSECLLTFSPLRKSWL